MEAHDAVTAANEAFYRTIETLNINEMKKAWLQADHIKCVHPGWPLLCGWGPIMASWERIFTSTQSMRFSLSDVRLEVSGNPRLGCADRKSRYTRSGWRVSISNFNHQSFRATRRTVVHGPPSCIAYFLHLQHRLRGNSTKNDGSWTCI